MDDRRAGETPLQLGMPLRRSPHAPQVRLPLQSAFKVETEQPLRTEQRHHMRSVCDGSRIGVGGFRMAAILRDALMRHLLPKPLAGPLVEAEDFPAPDILLPLDIIAERGVLL